MINFNATLKCCLV